MMTEAERAGGCDGPRIAKVLWIHRIFFSLLNKQYVDLSLFRNIIVKLKFIGRTDTL